MQLPKIVREFLAPRFLLTFHLAHAAPARVLVNEYTFHHHQDGRLESYYVKRNRFCRGPMALSIQVDHIVAVTVVRVR